MSNDMVISQLTIDLLLSGQPNQRDRGKHNMIFDARTRNDWQDVADFLIYDFGDLRTRVLDNFFNRCTFPEILSYFTNNIVDKCLEYLHDSSECDKREIELMHWIITCYKTNGDMIQLGRHAKFFIEKFGHGVPISLRKRLIHYIPGLESKLHKLIGRGPRRSNDGLRKKEGGKREDRVQKERNRHRRKDLAHHR